MVDKVEFKSAAYREGKTGMYEFDGSGKTVIAFFPGAFTGACTDEMCGFRDQMSEFEDLGAEVIGISVDTPFALEEFSEQNDLNFTLVSDQDAEIAESYGVKTAFPDLDLTVAGRAVFVVEEGEVVYTEILEDPGNLPDMEALKEFLRV